MGDDKKNAGFLVDGSALEQAKENCEHGELSEELRRTVTRLAYGAETTERERLREELETHRENIRGLQQEIQAKQNELSEERRKAERVEERLDAMRDMDAHYEGMLDAIESDLKDGKRVWADQPRIQKAAETAGVSTQEVLGTLRERNPDLPAEAFQEPSMPGDVKWRDVNDVSLDSVE